MSIDPNDNSISLEEVTGWKTVDSGGSGGSGGSGSGGGGGGGEEKEAPNREQHDQHDQPEQHQTEPPVSSSSSSSSSDDDEYQHTVALILHPPPPPLPKEKDQIPLFPHCQAHVPRLVCGTSYVFRIRVCNGVGWSDWTSS